MILAAVESKPANYQVALLLHTLGDDALKIYNGFSFDTPDDKRTTKEILDKFEGYAVGEVNESYEHFVFNNQLQREDESFDNFLSSVQSLSKTCNYCDQCKDSLLQDRNALGVHDADTQQTLLCE